jgi:cytochrome c peroxidase
LIGLFSREGIKHMLKNAIALLSVGCLFASSALAQDDLAAKARQRFEPIPTAPPEFPGNASTPAKVELGKMLYFDPRLSASHAISCSSCHNIGLGGADAEPTSIGHRWQQPDPSTECGEYATT